MADLNIYENVNRIRRSLKIKQNEIAALLGIQPSTFSRKERGEIPITAEELEIIAEKFNVTVSELTNKTKDIIINNELPSRENFLELTKVLLEKVERLENENKKLMGIIVNQMKIES